MTVRELYAYLDEKIPSALSCEWDNDGLMCCPNADAPVRRVLVTLDITNEAVETAIREGYDVILSHHPLIFRPLRALDPANPVASKVIRLLCAGVSAMSFHTRLDAVADGVNDVLCNTLGLSDVVPLVHGAESIGRIGHLPAPLSLAEFAQQVKSAIGADSLTVADAGLPVYRVAVLGGSGSDDVGAARAAGADTYLSGELGYHYLTDAPELAINLIAGGHFYTEQPVCERLRAWLCEADPALDVKVFYSNRIQTV